MKINKKSITVLWSLLFSVSVFSQFSQQSKLVSPDRGARDEYGTAVDIRADFAVSGSSRYNIAAGAAYIYTKDGNDEWSHHQTLIPDDAKEMAEFGGAVKITEDYIVVASGRADIGTTIRAGALYVYDRNGTSWDFNTKLTASDYSGDAKLGMNNTTIDAEGETIVSGAPGENGWIGSVYVFEHSGGVWSEVQKIENPANTNDSFGIAVALSGDTMVIGANESNGQRGKSYIYKKDTNGLWVLAQEITASDGASGDFFGSSVSIDSGTIIVGAYGSDRVRGAAYIYKEDLAGTWTEAQKLVASAQVLDAHFGWQCEVKGNRAVVSVPHAYAFTEGEAYVFQENDSGTWEETQILQGNDTAPEDFYGWAIALYEDQIIVGAPWEDEDENGQNPVDRAGSAYIFQESSLATEDIGTTRNGIITYPNPFENSFTIENNTKQINNVSVYATHGAVVQEITEIRNTSLTLNTQNLPKGLYLVKIVFEDESSTIEKLIKK